MQVWGRDPGFLLPFFCKLCYLAMTCLRECGRGRCKCGGRTLSIVVADAGCCCDYEWEHVGEVGITYEQMRTIIDSLLHQSSMWRTDGRTRRYSTHRPVRAIQTRRALKVEISKWKELSCFCRKKISHISDIIFLDSEWKCGQKRLIMSSTCQNVPFCRKFKLCLQWKSIVERRDMGL